MGKKNKNKTSHDISMKDAQAIGKEIESELPNINNRTSDKSDFSDQDKQLLENLNSRGRLYHLPLTNIQARITEGTQRRGHGVRVLLTADLNTTARFNDSLFTSINLDVYGDQAFRPLPYGLGFVAPSFLPLEVKLCNQKVSGLGKKYEAEFTIAGQKLSRGRVNEVLQAIKQHGDEPFTLELRSVGDDKLLGYFPTKASLIMASMQNDEKNQI